MQPLGDAPGPGMGAPAATYEFNDFENTTLASTARWAKWWGIISIASGALLLILGVLMIVVLGAAMATAPPSSSGGAAITPATVVAIGVSLIPASLVSIIGGVFYLMSGNSLQKVVSTQGEDVPLLMDAVKTLTRAFMIEAIALVVSFIIGFVIGLTMQHGGH